MKLKLSLNERTLIDFESAWSNKQERSAASIHAVAILIVLAFMWAVL